MALPSTNDAFAPVREHDRLSPTLSESHAATALPHTLSAAPAGLEVDTRIIHDNQGIQHPKKSLSPDPIDFRQKNENVEHHDSGNKSRKLCGLKVSLCWVVLIGVLAIGLAVGLGPRSRSRSWSEDVESTGHRRFVVRKDTTQCDWVSYWG